MDPSYTLLLSGKRVPSCIIVQLVTDDADLNSEFSLYFAGIYDGDIGASRTRTLLDLRILRVINGR